MMASQLHIQCDKSFLVRFFGILAIQMTLFVFIIFAIHDFPRNYKFGNNNPFKKNDFLSNPKEIDFKLKTNSFLVLTKVVDF